MSVKGPNLEGRGGATMTPDQFELDEERRLWRPKRRTFLFLGLSAVAAAVLPKWPAAPAIIAPTFDYVAFDELLETAYHPAIMADLNVPWPSLFKYGVDNSVDGVVVMSPGRNTP